jgi:glucose/arabinose dehydrogenase
VHQTLRDGRDLIPPIYEGSFGAYGCRLVATKRGELFATIGDAGDYSLPQDTNKLQGKILRITFDGKPFPGNPFHNEIYSYGHRNPQGLVLAANGILYASEHGPTHDDEVNIIELGGNYGWPTVGGITDEKEEFAFAQTHKVVDAIAFWTPTLAVCGLDYYGYSTIPEFHNSLLLCTLKEHHLRVLSLDSSGRRIVGERKILDGLYGRLRDVCVSLEGRVYFSTSNDKHHPDQMKAAFDGIYELRFDHRQDTALVKLGIGEGAAGKVEVDDFVKLKALGMGLGFLLLMGALYSFSERKDS